MQDDTSIPQDFQEQLNGLTPEQREATLAAFNAYRSSPTSTNEQATHKCPITGEDTPTHDARFPNTVTQSASLRAVDAQGRSVTFYNNGLGGGILARHLNADQSHEDDNDVTCWIDGIACTAVEFHMGGTGIVPLV